MLESLNVETIEQIYLKHKIFFLKQIRQNRTCNDVLLFLREKYEYFDQKNSSFCRQLINVKKKIYIDVIDYIPKTSIEIINHVFKNNTGLVDSIKYLVSQIKEKMSLNQNYFHFYINLNDLLKIEFKR